MVSLECSKGEEWLAGDEEGEKGQTDLQDQEGQLKDASLSLNASVDVMLGRQE